ncbi:hypothetical protein [Limosilactobacillus reuteri]|nr:hypothetical protein [Limosilactobacillus reuteri]PWT49609.1 hypothetical protein DKZ33_08435 [Limosilactobacillus reuteri]PWT61579.1 hypothetical protein DKZ32_07605 [Limosilactobacillus reuteri]
MAERRMISKSLLMDNRFLRLNNDTKTLYIYLLSFADDDGIVKRSMMIDSVLRVDDSNYSALEENGLIIPNQNDQIKVITDWNSLQSIRKDIYRQTTYLEVRSQLFMRTDYSYTKDPNDKNVFSSADDWIRNGRPKDITDFKPLIQQHLNDRNGIRNDDRNGVRNLSIDKNSIDKSRLEQYSTVQHSSAQQRAEKGNKENNYKYINSSSNGGMGETLLNDNSSTSSIENNATTENGENSGVDNRVNNQLDTNNNQDAISSLFNYLNGISPTDIPKDNKRLADVFDMLIRNGYEIEDIQLGIDNIMNVANQMPQYQNEQSLAKLLIQHLPEYTKQTLEQSSSND